ncbi:hypothetical protein [Desulfobacter vibrioformis]|uniref:hypothetical protein n=1 Tax=Desulfobacter vibrioformis TaxID=34031 RepID=UPI0012EC5996|nr:hypothetical protein [Desulfobacter vibrioformis]
MTGDDAVTLKLVAPEKKGLEIPIIISHDCDISNNPEVEPEIEIIIGTIITAIDGNCTHSKNARKLHLSAKHGDTDAHFELWATSKQSISKQSLLPLQPDYGFKLLGKELLTLQRWLAARYHRSAFPDEFDRRLKEQKGLYKAIFKTLKPLGQHIIAVFFDIDNGENVEKEADDLYLLDIYLLYSTEINPLAAEAATQKAAQSISEAFKKFCFNADSGSWQNIELVGCQPIADEVITYAQSQQLKKWNIDYLSFRDDPVQPLLTY